jgi:hypothetical protein
MKNLPKQVSNQVPNQVNWMQHGFQLSTSLVCTNSRSMKKGKCPPSSSVQQAEQVTVHGSAWFCKGFVLCFAQKEKK